MEHKIEKNFDDLLMSKALRTKGAETRPIHSLNDGVKIIQLHNELEKLTIELRNKKKDVEERMEALKGGWYHFHKKQKKFEGRMNKHLMKIEELKEKRQNIVERAAREENLYQMKLKEIEKLKLQLQSLQKVHKKQAMDIERYEPAQLILEATFMKAPETYFDSNMDPAIAVMQRYKSHTSNKDYLLARLAENTDQLLECQQSERKKKEKHQQELAVTYTKISELTKKSEGLETRNVMLEDKLNKIHKVNHEKNERLGRIIRSIEHLSIICEMHMPKLKKKSKRDTIPSKLHKIEDFLIFKSAVIEHAKKLVKAEMERRVNGTISCKTSVLSVACSTTSTNGEHSHI